MTNGNDYAFPQAFEKGLTKREYFAAMRKGAEDSLSKTWAEAIMGTPAPCGVIESIKWWIEAEEKFSVMRADALIKALNEKQ